MKQQFFHENLWKLSPPSSHRNNASYSIQFQQKNSEVKGPDFWKKKRGIEVILKWWPLYSNSSETSMMTFLTYGLKTSNFYTHRTICVMIQNSKENVIYSMNACPVCPFWILSKWLSEWVTEQLRGWRNKKDTTDSLPFPSLYLTLPLLTRSHKKGFFFFFICLTRTADKVCLVYLRQREFSLVLMKGIFIIYI